MKRLHLEKRGLRCLAVSESFGPESTRSVLAGVVMRKDLVIDGFVLGRTTISGSDSTDAVLDMYRRLGRPDINCVLLSGLIISMYNIVDAGKICRILGIPVIGVSYRDSDGISDIIRDRFDADRVKRYESLGTRERIRLGGSEVFVRCAGCTTTEAGRLLRAMTLEGSRPEPLRVARLLARAAAD